MNAWPRRENEEAKHKQLAAVQAPDVNRRHESRGMSERARWVDAGSEPEIADLLSDPIVQALMRADGICVLDLHASIAQLRFSQSQT